MTRLLGYQSHGLQNFSLVSPPAVAVVPVPVDEMAVEQP